MNPEKPEILGKGGMGMVLWRFWLYSFLGYLLEKAFAAASASPHQTRKCFLLLPLCPVYGLAVLAVLDDDPGTVLPFNGGPLGGRMVVLCGLEDQVDCLLPALSQAGIGRDCLKAVLTPHNRTWTAVKLYQELLREHQAMNGR